MVALTGGIGCGKSTVADALAARGAGVIDTDLIARALTEPEQPALAAIAAAFGDDLIGPEVDWIARHCALACSMTQPRDVDSSRSCIH